MEITLKELKRLKDKANAVALISNQDYYKAIVEYHSTAAEYYDNQIGSINNKDDLYEAKSAYHNKQKINTLIYLERTATK